MYLCHSTNIKHKSFKESMLSMPKINQLLNELVMHNILVSQPPT